MSAMGLLTRDTGWRRLTSSWVWSARLSCRGLRCKCSPPPSGGDIADTRLMVYPAQSPPETQEGEFDLEPAAGDEGGGEEVVCVISIGGFWIPFVCVCAHLDVTTSFRLSIFFYFFFKQLVHHRVLNCEPSESLVPILSPPPQRIAVLFSRRLTTSRRTDLFNRLHAQHGPQNPARSFSLAGGVYYCGWVGLKQLLSFLDSGNEYKPMNIDHGISCDSIL
jgi:hypothetical protein